MHEPGGRDRVLELLRRRTEANRAFFDAEAERLASLCHRMAERFSAGGRLLACGATAAARSDARHVAVEFVHPVIVGKRALPALGLAREAGRLPAAVAALARPVDVVLGLGGDGGSEDERRAVAGALAEAGDRGCLTVDLAGGEATWSFDPASPDPLVRQELAETLYHVLWELVHVFFEHPGLLEGKGARQAHDTGASRFLYPFLGQDETDLDAVLADVAASVRMKAAEVGELRLRTVGDGADRIVEAARALRTTFEAGGTVLALGNGGSATDAMDLVADLREPPGPWPSRRAIDLTEDSAILTAVGNDVGTDAMFSRQVIAYGREGDAVVAFSTSGSSVNVVRALEEARRRGLRSVALVGYDGGRIAAGELADVVIVAPSEHIPRIQEAHASAVHIVREVLEMAVATAGGDTRDGRTGVDRRRSARAP